RDAEEGGGGGAQRPPQGLGALLHARAPADDPAPRRRRPHGRFAPAGGVVLLFDLVPGRERASRAMRRVSPEVSARPPARPADRARLAFLSQIRLADRPP